MIELIQSDGERADCFKSLGFFSRRAGRVFGLEKPFHQFVRRRHRRNKEPRLGKDSTNPIAYLQQIAEILLYHARREPGTTPITGGWLGKRFSGSIGGTAGN